VKEIEDERKYMDSEPIQEYALVLSPQRLPQMFFFPVPDITSSPSLYCHKKQELELVKLIHDSTGRVNFYVILVRSQALSNRRRERRKTSGPSGPQHEFMYITKVHLEL
jgi:hypothetical protein